MSDDAETAAAVDDRRAVLRSLLEERIVDIVTTGRRTGERRVTEIWTTVVEGRVYVCGTPNASRTGVVRRPRDWLANLLAEPAFTLHLKSGVDVDLPARAEPVTDPQQRRHLLSLPATAYYRDAVSLDAAVRHSPMVSVTFVGGAAWLNDAVRDAAADRT